MTLRSSSTLKKEKIEESSRKSKASIPQKDKLKPQTSGNDENVSECNPYPPFWIKSLVYNPVKNHSLRPQYSPFRFYPSNAFMERKLSLPRKIYLATRFPPTVAQFYIDKTPIINLLTKRRRLYITGPVQFGKSMALSTIHKFISKTSRFDWNMEVLTIDDSETSGTRKRFAIMDKEKYKYAHEHFYKQFHVLFFNFCVLLMSSFDSFFESYLLMLQRALGSWETLIVNDNYRIEFQNLLDSISNMNEKNCNAIMRAIDILEDDIHASDSDSKGNYQTLKVAVLIDDFDSAYIRAMDHGFGTNFGKFIEKQFDIFKNSQIFQLIYFTGVYRISLFSESNAQNNYLDNLTNLTVFSSKCSEFFGFGENDIDSILKWAYNGESFDEVKKLLKDHYGGYHEQDNNLIYHPCSISRALACEKIDIYWTCDGTISLIDELFSKITNSDIIIDFGKLLGSTELSSIDILDEVSTITKMPTITNTEVGSQLLELGLVTQCNDVYFIPNLQVRESFIEYIKRRIFFSGNNFQDKIVPHLFNQNIVEFFHLLRGFTENLFIDYSNAYFYLVSMFILLSMHKAEPKDIGYERTIDGHHVLRIDFPGKKVAYLFEIKVVPSKKNKSFEDFEESAVASLDQIREEAYWNYYQGNETKKEIKTLFIMGVAFYQKSFYVAYEEYKMNQGIVGNCVKDGSINMTQLDWSFP